MIKFRLISESLKSYFILAFGLLFFSSFIHAQTVSLDVAGVDFSFLNTNRTTLSGTPTSSGSVVKYANVLTTGGVTVYAKVTMTLDANVTISNYDDDTAKPGQFQPIINTSTGGIRGATYKMEFFDTATDFPIYLRNFILTGMDVDGNPANWGNPAYTELYRLSNQEYSAYRRSDATALTTSTVVSGSLFQILGAPTSINDTNFDNSNSFLADYNSSKTSITFFIGNTNPASGRLAAMKLGTAGGTFTGATTTTSNPTTKATTDLQILKSVNSSVALANTNVIFTLAATNLGAAAATGVQVGDLLPSGYTFVSASAPSGTTYNSTTGVWTIGNLAASASLNLQIIATVKATGNRTNVAIITGNEIDSNLTNNTASAIVTLADPCKFGAIPGTVTANDRDGDGIADDCDLDDDNDGILDTAELYCDTTTAPNVTYPATNSPAAAPLYAKQLLFFDWSGVNLSPTSPSATKSVVYNDVTYTATISNYTSVGTGTPNAMVGNDILTWSGPSQMVGRYYNVNSTTFKEALYIPSTGFTGVNSFNISVTASKDGAAYPVDFVFFDAETTNKSATQTEQIKFTNNTAGTIELLEKTGTGTIGTTTDGVVNITGIGTNTVTLNETETSNVNALLFVKGYSPSVKVDITTSVGSKQGVGFAVRLYCDTDNDGTPNYLDTDSDGDGCPDAVEGSENVTSEQVHSLDLLPSDPNYPFRGQIKVIYNGVTENTSQNIISTSPSALGVPQLVNNAGNNYHVLTNPSNLAGVADNTGTAPVAGVGQGFGSAYDATVNSCICYNDANTTGTALPTKHGITLLQRAGADNGNWPMNRSSAHTVLESNTKGFVITRMNPTEIAALTGQEGMMVYDTTAKCLKIYADGTWKCFSKPSCP